MDRFIKRDELEQITSLKDPTLWREENAGRFPKRRKLTTNRVGWLESEVISWMQSRLNADGEVADVKRDEECSRNGE